MAAGTISLILNFVFVFILVIGFLTGLWRGVKKASINLGFAILGMIIAFFITVPITYAILNINIYVDGGYQPINTYLVSLLQQNADIAHLIELTPGIEQLIAQLPNAIASVIVFLVISALMEFVMYLFTVIFSAIFIKKKDKEGNKLPKYRIAGGFVGLAKTLIVLLFVFMPFVSLTGTARDVISSANADYVVETQAEETDTQVFGQTIPPEAMKALDGFNTSAFGVIGNMFGLDNAMFDYLSKCQVGEQTVYIRSEVTNYASVYAAYTQVQQLFDGTDTAKFTNLDFDKLENTVNTILDSGLYKSIVSDVLKNVIVNYKDFSFINFSDDINAILDDVGAGLANANASEYFASDVKAIFNVCKTISTSGALDEIKGKTVNEILDILSNKTFTDFSFKNAIYDLLNTNIMRDGGKSALNYALSSAIEGVDEIAVNLRGLSETQLHEVADSLANAVSNYSSIVKNVELETVLNDPMSLLKADSTVEITPTFTKLGKLIDEIRGNLMLKNAQGNSIIEGKLAELDMTLPQQPVKKVDGTEVTITNYGTLMNFVSPSLETLKAINVYDSLTANPVVMEDVLVAFANACKEEPNTLADIILPLSQVNPTQKMLVDEMLKTIDNSLLSFKDVDGYDNWKYELKYVSSLLTALNKGDVEGKTYLSVALGGDTKKLLLNLGSDVTIKDILAPIMYANSTSGIKASVFENFESVFNGLVEPATPVKFDYLAKTFKEENAEDQTAEVCKIFEKFVAFYGEYQEGTTKLADLNKIKLGEFLDALKENAYRTKFTPTKTEAGLFADSFTLIIDKVKQEYPMLASQIGDDYSAVNYTEMFTQLEEASNGI